MRGKRGHYVVQQRRGAAVSCGKDAGDCVAVVPVVLSAADPEAKLRALKKELGTSSAVGFGAPASAATTDAPLDVSEKKWELAVHNIDEWASWLFLQKVERNLDADNIYIQVRRQTELSCALMGVRYTRLSYNEGI